jgi:hypothetical protein
VSIIVAVQQSDQNQALPYEMDRVRAMEKFAFAQRLSDLPGNLVLVDFLRQRREALARCGACQSVQHDAATGHKMPQFAAATGFLR